MAFADVLDSWEAAGRLGDRSAATDLLTLLGRADTQVYDNLDSDSQVTDDLRDELLEHLINNGPATPQTTMDCVTSFCRQTVNQLTGAADAVAQSASLGHVKSREAWQKYYESTYGSSVRGFATRRGRSAALTIDDLLNMSVDQQRVLLTGRHLSRYNMWSIYQSAHPNAPFTNVTTTYDELKRRLGLGFLEDPNVEALYWAHSLQLTQTAHRPTALDAADYRFYRPGGRTSPLYGPANGLPEVVHIPVDGDQLVEPISST